MDRQHICDLFDLTGRTALVTGSSRGIGREIALVLARAGATVIVHGLSDTPKLRETAALITAGGGRAECVIADLTVASGTESLIEQCDALKATIDILVLNASVQSYVRVEQYDETEFLREFQANLGSSFRLMQAFSHGMRQRKWGRIVTVGSVNQMRPSPRLSIYSTTKAALANLTANAAKTFGADNVTVNNLVPGVILTDRNTVALQDEQLRNSILGSIPAARFGTADELAGAALLLCGPAGGYITGIELPVTGGMHL